jgi:hypothetical protein
MQFLCGFYPIITAVARFTKYHSPYYQDTQASKEKLQQREEEGIGNVERNVPFGDADVSYMNSVLRNAGNQSPLEIVKHPEGNKLKIPRNLALNSPLLSLRVDEKLKGCVREDSQGNFLFPLETTYRFLEQRNASTQKFVLNIGNEVNKNTDVVNVRELVGTETLPPERQTLTDTALQNQLKLLQDRYPHFPPISAKILENGNIKFEMADG